MTGKYSGPSDARRAASRRDYLKNRDIRLAAVKARYLEKLGGVYKRARARPGVR